MKGLQNIVIGLGTLWRAVAPHESIGRSVYPLPRSWLPRDLDAGLREAGNRHMIGLHFEGISKIASPLFIGRGINFEGDGPAFIFDDRELLRSVRRKGESRTTRRLGYTSRTIGTALHEIAHSIDESLTQNPEVTHTQALEATREIFSVGPVTATKGVYPWKGHYPRWIRIALHLYHRATSFGIDVSIWEVFTSENYALSNGARYLALLDDEPKRCASMSFAEICKHYPPEPFQRLFLRNMEHWQNIQNLPTAPACSHPAAAAEMKTEDDE